MKKVLPILLSLSLVFLAGTAVGAQTTDRPARTQPLRPEAIEALEIRQEERQAQRQQWLDQRCDVLENHLSVQINRYQNNADKHTARYERMVARLNALVARLQADGVDTTKLEAAIGVFTEKVQLFAHNAASYVESLKATQGFACGESEGDFRNVLVESRSLLQILRENVLEIRTYWQETLRPLITQLVSTDSEE